MPGGHYIALSGMRARLDELDRLSVDLANAGTSGYKSVRAGTVESERPQFETVLETAIDVTSGPRRIDVSAGTVVPTGRTLDMSIGGNGFFTVETQAGMRYTRNGHFATNPEGLLTAEGGSIVQGEDGPIEIGSGEVNVDPDGTIRQGNRVAGKLLITSFDDSRRLVSESGSLLRADGLKPQEAAGVTVHSGTLEESNVSVIERLAELTNVSRNFEALQRAVSVLMNDVDGRAIDYLGRR